MPIDRLVRAVHEWAGARGRRGVFAQIDPTDWRPRHLRWAGFLDPASFRERVRSASVLVAHTEMGSILTALEAGGPILVMPQRGSLKETRNDHQVSTAKRFFGLAARGESRGIPSPGDGRGANHAANASLFGMPGTSAEFRHGPLGRVAVAMDETELPTRLDEVDRLAAAAPISPYASVHLIEAVREFIHSPRSTSR